MGYYVGNTWRLLEEHIWTTWQVLGDKDYFGTTLWALGDNHLKT